MAKEFIVSGDSHVVEPVDLYKTRLPKNMRDQALWEEDTILEDPLVPGGHTQFRTVHTAGTRAGPYPGTASSPARRRTACRRASCATWTGTASTRP